MKKKSFVLIALVILIVFILGASYAWLQITLYGTKVNRIKVGNLELTLKNESEGILLENESGKLLISIDTIENLVNSVVNEFSNVKTVNCKVKLDKQINNVIIDMNLIVANETIIKDLSLNLQNKIKDVIKRTTEIEVKEINIKIKNIENQKNNV